MLMQTLLRLVGSLANHDAGNNFGANASIGRDGLTRIGTWPRIAARYALLLLACLTIYVHELSSVPTARLSAIPAAEAAQRGTQSGQRDPRDQAEVFRTEVPERPYDIVLGNPTETSVTASIRSASALAGYFEYGDRSSNYQWRSDLVQLRPGVPSEVILDRLSPNSQYFYRWQTTTGLSGSESASNEFSFWTQRTPGATFVFTVQADSHLDARTDTRLYETTLRNAKAADPDFHIDLGDTFMTDKRRTDHRDALPQYHAQRYYFSLIGSNAPVFLVSGNHDGEGMHRGAMGKWAREQRETYFATPSDGAQGRGNYYSWEWGDSLFVVLDPFWESLRVRRGGDYWARTLGKDQFRWLSKTLRSSEARFKFVFIHHLVGGANHEARGGVTAAVLFEWGGRAPDGTHDFNERRPDWAQPIHALLADTGVTAVFHGHDHVFAREDLDGIAYVLVPQPGLDRFRSPRDISATYPGPVVIGGPGHVRVTVSPQAAVVDLVQTRLGNTDQGNGRIVHTFRLAPICIEDCQ